ncbi:hypothetical protein TNCV_1438241 [Trichonephila clavipes]|nr:hypothetical protein TNCV_1438241 [Trichonephila clavipes]
MVVVHAEDVGNWGCSVLQVVASVMGKLSSMLHDTRAIPMKIVLFNFKILQDLETNILDDESNENELEIFE